MIIKQFIFIYNSFLVLSTEDSQVDIRSRLTFYAQKQLLL